MRKLSKFDTARFLLFKRNVVDCLYKNKILIYTKSIYAFARVCVRKKIGAITAKWTL